MREEVKEFFISVYGDSAKSFAVSDYMIDEALKVMDASKSCSRIVNWIRPRGTPPTIASLGVHAVKSLFRAAKGRQYVMCRS